MAQPGRMVVTTDHHENLAWLFYLRFFQPRIELSSIKQVDGCVLIRLSHTAKIGATFQTESGMAGPLDGPEGDRAAEFPEKLLASWGSGSVGVTTR